MRFLRLILPFPLILSTATVFAQVATPDVKSTSENHPVTFNITENDIPLLGNIDPSTVDLNVGLGGRQSSATTSDGDYTVNSAGDLTFTPNPGYNGITTLNYTVEDDNGNVTLIPGLVTITVTPDNPPTASDDNSTTNEEVATTLDVVSNDSDPENDLDESTVDLDTGAPGIQTTNTTGAGSWSVNNVGIVSFSPATNITGNAQLTYTVNDGIGQTSNVASITISVTNVNDIPVANNDASSTVEDTPVTLNILANDTDGDGNATLNSTTVDLDPSTGGQQTSVSATEGVWSVAAGVVTFNPASDFTGPASISYTVNDNAGATSNTATVTITVTAVNDPPTANDDAATTNEETAVTINVLLNDTDPEGNGTINSASVDLNTSSGGTQTTATTAEGTWSVAGGIVTFTPAADITVPATLSYTVNDLSGATSNSAVITVTINNTNDPPHAVDDVTSTSEETVVTLNVVSNDTDSDGNGTINAATVDLNTTSGGIQNTATTGAGSWSVNAAGVVTFTPGLDFTGPAILQYTVNDNASATSNAATITVNVSQVNDAPHAIDDAATTLEDNSTTINVVSNDTDIEGNLNIATVDLNTASPGIQTTNSTGGGSFSVNASGIVTFTPSLNINGTTTLDYTVNDNAGATSNAATITVNVTPVNDAPVASGDATSTSEETTVTINVVSNDTDPDGNSTVDVATVDLNVGTAGIQNTNTTGTGSWSVSTTGVVTFTPADNYSGSATLAYTVNDTGGLTSNQATISITVIASNDPPVAVNDAATTAEDTPVSLNVTTNDTDEEGTVRANTVDLDTGTPGIQNTHVTPNGTFSVNGSGLVTFTPKADYNGPASTTYTVEDNSGATSNVATITITITPVNDLPDAVDDVATTSEEVAITFNIVSNDTDVDDGINAASVDLNTATGGIQNANTTPAGSWSVTSTGALTFTPGLNFSGPATLSYTVNDISGATSAPATITITVTATNDPPTAVNDATSTNEGTPVSINVLTNDSDIDGTINASTVDLNTSTGGIQNSNTTDDGTWTVNGSGLVTFTPTAEFNGPTTLTYTVNDNLGAPSNMATISITVNAVNDPPVAVNDAATTSEETSVSIDVTANDDDIDGTIVKSTVDLNVSSPGIQNSITIAAGTFTVNSSGMVTYVPASNFNAVATLNYTVNDNGGATSNQATISVTVTPTNDPPVAVNDAVSTNEETPVTLNVVTNDTDIDGSVNPATVDLDPSSPGIQSTATISGGTISVNSTGIITFTPTVNFYGLATATYTVNDNSGTTSNTATITITVNAVNDPPIAVNDLDNADEGEIVTINVVSNDLDVDGSVNAATVDLNTGSSGIQNTITTAAGTFTVNSSGIVTYSPATNFNGTASITYTVRDDVGATSNAATISISVNSVNSDPSAVNDVATTNEDTPINISILTNDSDPDGTLNATTVDLNTAVAGIQNTVTNSFGTFAVNTSGVLTYTPASNFNGPASITYTVNDNVGATSNAASVNITVTSVNDLPTAVNDATTTNEGTAVSINVVTNDTDADGTIDPNTVDLNTGTAGIQNSNTTPAGSWMVNNVGLVTFTPVANFSGNATLNYRVNDNSGGTSNAATITITVSSQNDAPVAVNDAMTTNEDVVTSLNVISNDSDVDGTINATTVDLNTASPGIQNSTTVTGGTFTVNTAGVVTFTPTLNFFGTATTNYTVNDDGGLTSNVATITITVNSVNDLPVAVNDAATTSENTAVTFNVISNDSDVDGGIDPATVDLNLVTAGIQNSNTTAAGTWAVAAGSLTFTPANNFNGAATLNYRVNDVNGGTSNTATITVTVTAVNDIPVANNDAATTNEDVVVTLNVVSNDTDDEGPVNATSVDLNTATSGIQNTITVTGGTFTVSTLGIVTFTPALDYNGTATTTYTVNDAGGATSNAATITVTINSVNDAPVAVNDAVTINEDNSTTIPVLINDGDVDGTLNAATVDLNTTTTGIQNTNTTAQGTFTVNTAGVVTFTPLANFTGVAALGYRVNDDQGLTSNTATITVTVQPINDPPTFAPIPDQRVLRNSAQKTITVTGISAGPLESEGLLLTVTSGNTGLIPQPSYTLSTPTATITFQPVANQTGTATITVKLVDSGLNEYTQTFNIEVVDVRITSTPVTVAVENEPYEYNVTVTDVTETLTLTAVTKPGWTTFTTLPSPPNPKNRGRLSGSNATSGGAVKIQVKDGATVLDEQNFTIVLNHRPVVTSFHIEMNEDELLIFSQQKFQDVYTDQDGQALSEIQFTKLPRHGTLKYANGNPVNVADKIPFANIATIQYKPQQEYSGLDTLYWKASDGSSYNNTNPFIDFKINAVNDPPEITSLETEPVVFELVDRTPVQLSAEFNAKDADDLNLTGAEVSFLIQNFTPGKDKLTFTNTATINGTYNGQTGILLLAGSATVQEYVDAIRSIQYSYENFTESEPDRTVRFVLNDGKNTSTAKERIIRLNDEGALDLDIPNVFTPDGRGGNELWKITIMNSDPGAGTNAVVKIYDKRGKLVFETIGFDKEWDGKSMSGENLPVDTYFYTIDLKREHNDRDLYKGVVTILR